MRKIKGFTLAEVLITLTIIGVVAALTIPTLWAKINQKVSENRQEVIEDRLLDGINRYSAMEDGLSMSYETTYDFLVGLSKHYKMSQICKADEITKCIPYSTITYTSDGEDKTVEVSSLTSIDKFMAEGADDYLAPASFITAQGTPMIMAFKKDCVWDMGKAMRSIEDSGCIAYMYDESGTRNPNKLGKDWVQHGLTITNIPIATVGGYKIMNTAFFQTTGLSNSECETEKAKNYGITKCSVNIDSWSNGDTWAAAMKYCHDKGWRLPNEAESLAIVNGLFKDDSGNHPSGSSWDSSTYKLDSELVITTLRLKNNDVRLWGSAIYNGNDAYRRYFATNHTNWSRNSGNRSDTDYQVLCISD